MEVAVYPAAQLGSMREIVESTQLGAIQIVPCFTAVASMFSPKAELMAAPFLFPTVAHAWYVLDGSFGKELAGGNIERLQASRIGIWRSQWIQESMDQQEGRSGSRPI